MESSPEEAVVVGSVGHVIRRAFLDLFTPPSSSPPSAAVDGAPSTAALESKEVDDKLMASQGAAPAAAAAVPPDPRAAAEIDEIDSRLHVIVDRTKRLEQYLWDVSAAAADQDVKQAAELRDRGLILGTEVPLGPSQLAIDRGYLENEGTFGSVGKGLVLARDVMAKHELQAAVRSGNAGQVGKRAPDFVSTAEDPNYLKLTSAQAVRAEAIKARAELSGTAKMKAARTAGGAPSSATTTTKAGVKGKVMATLDETEVTMLGAGVPDEYEMRDDEEEGGGGGGKVDTDGQSPKPRTTFAATGATDATASGGKKKKSAEPMSKDDLDANEAVSKRMTQKLNFLKNPRHVPPPKPGAAKVYSLQDDAAVPAAPLSSTTAKLAVAGMGEGQVGLLKPGDTKGAQARAGVAPMANDGEALSGPFAVAPGRCTFNKYEVDQEVSAVLTIRNQDSVSRMLRVLPPTTPFFSMDPLVYPGKHRGEGQVAPGMSLKATIRFKPNSLAAFDDYITLMTELGSFKVPLHASMPAPMLTLPLELYAGCCIRGDELISTVVFENAGKGGGKFRVFSQEEWPAVNPGPATSDLVSFGPFELSPSYFEVPAGGHMAMTLKFAPPAVGAYKGGFVIVCDNCDVTQYTITGNSAELDVVVSKIQGLPVGKPTFTLPPDDASASVSGPHSVAPPAPPSASGASKTTAAPVSLSEPITLIAQPKTVGGLTRAPEEYDPSHAPVRLSFDPVASQRTARKTIVVKNPTLIPLRYEWFADAWWTGEKPIVGGERPQPVSMATGTQRIYTVSPANGLLDPGAEVEFTFMFSPDNIGAFQRSLRMCILDVPLVGERRKRYETRFLRAEGISPSAAAGEEGGMYSPSSPGAKSALSVMSAPMRLQTADGGSVVGSSAIPREFAEAVAVYLQGTGKPCDVLVTPGVVRIPGPLLPGHSGSQQFRLLNLGDAPTWFTFNDAVFTNGPELAFPVSGDGDDSPRDARLPTITVSPSNGQLKAGGYADVTVTFNALPVEASVKGQYEATISARIDYQSYGIDKPPAWQTVSALVVASTRVPEVTIVEPEVDMGLSAVDKIVKRKITLKNLCNSPSQWAMVQPEWSLLHEPSSPVFTAGRGVTISFSPATGTLPPHGSVEVTLSCKAASIPLRVRDMIACVVPGSQEPVYCRVRGEVQTAAAYLSTQSLNLGVSFVAVNVSKFVTITNLSNFPAPYKFDALLCPALNPTPLYHVSASPSSGVLPPKSSKEVAVTFTPLHQGTVDTLVCFDVEGLPQPLGIAIRSEIKGLVVGYSQLDPKSTPTLPMLPVSTTPEQKESNAYRFAKDCAAKVGGPVSLQFGDDLPLMTQRTLRLTVHNLSGIPSDVGLYVKTYSTPDATPAADLLVKLKESAVGAGKQRRRSTNPKESIRSFMTLQRKSSVSSQPGGAVVGTVEGASGAVPSQASVASLDPSNKTSKASTVTAQPSRASMTASVEKTASVGEKPAMKASTRGGATAAGATGSVASGPSKLLTSAVEKTKKFQTEAGQEVLRARETEAFLKEKLADHRGAAFWVDNQLRYLSAWGAASFEISVAGDLPGVYTDELMLTLNGEGEDRMQTIVFPLSVTLSGSPLTFDDTVVGVQLTGARGPQLVFGELPVRSAAQTKSVRIKNSGAQDAVLRWNLQYPPAASATAVVSQAFTLAPGVGGAITVTAADSASHLPPLCFSVSPTIVCIPARGQAEVAITADPVEWSPEESAAVSALGLLAPSGARQALMVADVEFVNKGEGESVVKLGGDGAVGGAGSSRGVALSMTATVKPVVPYLFLDKRLLDNSQWIKFSVWANKPSTHESYTRQITLTNTLAASLTFSLSSSGPYNITSCATNAPKHPLASPEATGSVFRPNSRGGAPRVFTLIAGTHVVIDVAFDPTHESAKPLEASLFGATLTGGVNIASASDLSATGGAGGGASSGDGVKRLREEFVGGLIITFSNGTVQTVNLRCEKLRPAITAAPPATAFGVVHVERRASSVVYLSNPTAVEAEWELRHMPIPARKAPVTFDAKSLGLIGKPGLRLDATPRDDDDMVDDPSVFDFNVKGGCLKGPSAALHVAAVHGLRGSHTPPVGISVTFAPKQNVRYRCRYRVFVKSGEGFDVVLTGQGSYEENQDRKR